MLKLKICFYISNLRVIDTKCYSDIKSEYRSANFILFTINLSIQSNEYLGYKFMYLNKYLSLTIITINYHNYRLIDYYFS